LQVTADYLVKYTLSTLVRGESQKSRPRNLA